MEEDTEYNYCIKVFRDKPFYFYVFSYYPNFLNKFITALLLFVLYFDYHLLNAVLWGIK